MDVLHKLAVKLQRSKLLQLIFSAFILFLVYAAYKYQQSNSFSSMSELYRKNDNEKKTLTPDDNLLSVSNNGDDAPGDGTNLELPVIDSAVPIDVMITFTKAEHNSALQTKFRTCISSLFHFATVPVNLHILGDERSRQTASEILDQSVDKSKYSVSTCVFYCWNRNRDIGRFRILAGECLRWGVAFSWLNSTLGLPSPPQLWEVIACILIQFKVQFICWLLQILCL